MRFKLIDRILLVIVLIGLLVLSAGAIAFGLLLFPASAVHQIIDYVYVYWVNSAIIISVSLLVVIIALRLIYASCSGGKKRLPASLAIKQDAGGSINVTLPTFSTIVQRAAAGCEGIATCENTILPQEEGMNVALRVTLQDDAIIPEVTARLQETVKDSVLRFTGVTVNQVHVMVENPPAKKSGV